MSKNFYGSKVKGTGFYQLDKQLTSKLGLVLAGVLSIFVDMESYCYEIDSFITIDSDRYFYLKLQDLSIRTGGLTEPTLINAIKKLKELGVLESTKRPNSLDRRSYYRVIESKLIELCSKN